MSDIHHNPAGITTPRGMIEPKVTHGVSEADSRERFEAAASRYPDPMAHVHPHSLLAGERPILRVLEVSPGVSVDDLDTVDALETVRRQLTDDALSIEGQLDTREVDALELGRSIDLDWQRRAKGALRAKRALLHEVNLRRSKLVAAEKATKQKSRDRAILDELRARHPDEFRSAVNRLLADRLID